MSHDLIQPSSGENDAVPQAEESEFGLNAWDAISGWLNLPLVDGGRSMLPQILSFFSENAMYEGKGSFLWRDNRGNEHSSDMQTAHMVRPRPDYMGIPTEGWYVLQYSLP